MAGMWYNSSLIQYLVATVLILLIVFLAIETFPFFSILLNFILALALPLVASGLFYYLLRPLRNFLESKNIPRIWAIIILYLSIAVAIAITIIFVWPYISGQISEFVEQPEYKIEEVQRKTISILNIFNFTQMSTTELKELLNNYLKIFIEWLSQDIIGLLANITRIASFIIFTPIILFYLLKDGEEFSKVTSRLFPKHYRPIVKNIMADLDETLSDFISGQFQVAAIDAFLLYIGYSLIGLPYALIFALFALFFNLIPFVGTFIATIPAFIIGFGVSPLIGLYVLIVVTIVHAIDANLISPSVLGRKLQIHPLTIILILLAAGSLYGILGLLLATPLYALLKTLLIDLYEEKEEVGL